MLLLYHDFLKETSAGKSSVAQRKMNQEGCFLAFLRLSARTQMTEKSLMHSKHKRGQPFLAMGQACTTSRLRGLAISHVGELSCQQGMGT